MRTKIISLSLPFELYDEVKDYQNSIMSSSLSNTIRLLVVKGLNGK